MLPEKISVSMRGRWQDKVYDLEGNLVSETPWQHNQIQHSAAKLVTGLLRRYAEFAATTFTGISYLAVGEGQAGWDAVPPAQPKADVALDTEVFRKAIAPADMAYIDAFAGAVVAGPSRFVRVTATLLPAEANFSLREFGLFGGDADGVADSGLMLNWVVHPRFDKTNVMTLVRVIEIEVQES